MLFLNDVKCMVIFLIVIIEIYNTNNLFDKLIYMYIFINTYLLEIEYTNMLYYDKEDTRTVSSGPGTGIVCTEGT